MTKGIRTGHLQVTSSLAQIEGHPVPSLDMSEWSSDSRPPPSKLALSAVTTAPSPLPFSLKEKRYTRRHMWRTFADDEIHVSCLDLPPLSRWMKKGNKFKMTMMMKVISNSQIKYHDFMLNFIQRIIKETWRTNHPQSWKDCKIWWRYTSRDFNVITSLVNPSIKP